MTISDRRRFHHILISLPVIIECTQHKKSENIPKFFVSHNISQEGILVIVNDYIKMATDYKLTIELPNLNYRPKVKVRIVPTAQKESRQYSSAAGQSIKS